MNQRFTRVALLSLLVAILGSPALATEQTVTLSVPGMTCAACPFTVRTALNRVEGVAKADVSYKKFEAKVIFDDEKTTVEALINATTNAGYPSSIKNTDSSGKNGDE